LTAPVRAFPLRRFAVKVSGGAGVFLYNRNARRQWFGHRVAVLSPLLLSTQGVMPPYFLGLGLDGTATRPRALPSRNCTGAWGHYIQLLIEKETNVDLNKVNEILMEIAKSRNVDPAQKNLATALIHIAQGIDEVQRAQAGMVSMLTKR